MQLVLLRARQLDVFEGQEIQGKLWKFRVVNLL